MNRKPICSFIPQCINAAQLLAGNIYWKNARPQHCAPVVLALASVVFIAPQVRAAAGNGEQGNSILHAGEAHVSVPLRGGQGDNSRSGPEAVASRRRSAATPGREIEMDPGKVFKDCGKCPEMIVIPEGVSELYGKDSTDRVTLGRFAMSKTEVTQGQWKAIMGQNPSAYANCGENCPVDQVSWDDVQEFIIRLNQKTGKKYRFPTATEWEYCCRAGMMQKYCGGDDVDSVAWYKGNSGGKTNPVAQKRANAFGLYDMSGNVWEWVEDDHSGGDQEAASPAAQTQTNASSWYGSSGGDWEEDEDDYYPGSYGGTAIDYSSRQDDVGKQALYGGSWLSSPQGVRAGRRIRVESGNRSGNFGFRLARGIP